MRSPPSVQLYSDGSEAAWIEPSVDGQEPERPTPVLDLAAATDAAEAATDGDPATTATGDEADHAHGEVENEPAGLALFLSILAPLAGIGGVVLGWRANRRTVSS